MHVLLRNLMAFRSSPDALVEICESAHLISSRSAQDKWNDIPAPLLKKTTIIDDFTVENVITAIDALKRPISAAVTTDELAIIETAYANAHVNPDFGDPERHRIFRDKLMMKERLKPTRLQFPRHCMLDRTIAVLDPALYYRDLANTIGKHLFIKPVEGAGCENTAEIRSEDEFVAWLNVSSDEIRYEVDEFVTGVFYHINAVLVEGEIAQVLCFRHAYPNAAFFSGRPLACIVEPDDSNIHSKLSLYAADIISSFPELSENGLVDIDCCVQNDERIVFMELASRAGGGMTAQMFQIHTGVNSEELHFRLQMGLPREIPTRKGPYAAFLWYPQKFGDVVELIPPSGLSSELVLDWKLAPGTKGSTPKSIRDTSLAVTIANFDFAVLEDEFARLCDHSPIRYSSSCNTCICEK